MQNGLSRVVHGSWSNASVQKELNCYFIVRLKSRLHNGLQHSHPIRVSIRLEETDNLREWVSSVYTEYVMDQIMPFSPNNEFILKLL